MVTKYPLNHHSAGLLPYIELDGKLFFILEQKDPGYKPPFFDNALNFLGGNWKKGVNPDKSPEELIRREISEEFWDSPEAPESLNELLGREFLTREADIDVKAYDTPKNMEKLRQVGRTVGRPLSEPGLIYAAGIFLRELSPDEFKSIEAVLEEFGGKVTTDNVKRGSRVVAVSLDEINQKNIKCAWGYDYILNDLLYAEKLPHQEPVIIRPLRLIEVMKIREEELQTSPTFEAFEKAGYKYRE